MPRTSREDFFPGRPSRRRNPNCDSAIDKCWSTRAGQPAVASATLSLSEAYTTSDPNSVGRGCRALRNSLNEMEVENRPPAAGRMPPPTQGATEPPWAASGWLGNSLPLSILRDLALLQIPQRWRWGLRGQWLRSDVWHLRLPGKHQYGMARRFVPSAPVQRPSGG